MVKAGKVSTLILIIGYLVFLIITIKTSVVDAVVLLLSEEFGNKKIYKGTVKLSPISNKLASLQYVLSNPTCTQSSSSVIVDNNPPSTTVINNIENSDQFTNSIARKENLQTNTLEEKFSHNHIETPIRNYDSNTSTLVSIPNQSSNVEIKTQERAINFKVVEFKNDSGINSSNKKFNTQNSQKLNNEFQSNKNFSDSNNVLPNQSNIKLSLKNNYSEKAQNLNSQVISDLENSNSLNTGLKPNVINNNSTNRNSSIYTQNNYSIGHNNYEIPSITSIIKSILTKRWIYNSALDRYIVRLDKDLVVVLTIRPNLQNMLENLFEHTNCKIGCAIIQDPITGAILAMTSYEKGNKPLSPESLDFIKNNWALRSNLPVASLFKIVTAAAGIERAGYNYNSLIKLGKKWSMSLWEAFAKSHNSAFGVIGKKVGREILQKYANSFGFNKQFFFDLPVQQSVAEIPSESTKLGHAAAGLYRDLEISPIHAITLVSTVVNGGKFMKPYLVDYILKGNQVIFRRKPFQLSQPISPNTASQIYDMMKTTITHGTGKRGFCKYDEYDDIANYCGGKTGTLTGKSPKLLITWFGGYTKYMDKDISILFMVGQQGFSNTKAADLAGKFTYLLSMNYNYKISSNNKTQDYNERYCVR